MLVVTGVNLLVVSVWSPFGVDFFEAVAVDFKIFLHSYVPNFGWDTQTSLCFSVSKMRPLLHSIVRGWQDGDECGSEAK